MVEVKAVLKMTGVTMTLTIPEARALQILLRGAKDLSAVQMGLDAILRQYPSDS